MPTGVRPPDIMMIFCDQEEYEQCVAAFDDIECPPVREPVSFLMDYNHGRGRGTPVRERLSLGLATSFSRETMPTGVRPPDVNPGREGDSPAVTAFLDTMNKELDHIRRRDHGTPSKPVFFSPKSYLLHWIHLHCLIKSRYRRWTGSHLIAVT